MHPPDWDPPRLIARRAPARPVPQGIYTQSQAQFGSYVEAGTLLNNYAHVLDLLTRLRQAINHPYLVIYSKREMENGGVGSGGNSGAAGGICGLCFEDADDAVLTGCGHPFCRQCMRDYVETLAVEAVSQCPTCQQPLSVDLAAPVSAPAASAYGTVGHSGGVAAVGHARRGLLSRVDLSKFQVRAPRCLCRVACASSPAQRACAPIRPDLAPISPRSRPDPSVPRASPRLWPPRAPHQSSTKIEALMEELHLMKENDPSAKAIVFSQFVSFLDVVEHRLLVAGVRVVKLNGGMTAAAREAVLTSFKEDPSVTAILISLKAGGVALNLTVASHIYLMDPWCAAELAVRTRPTPAACVAAVLRGRPRGVVPRSDRDHDEIRPRPRHVRARVRHRWNPAAEYQAIDRAHRLGQQKPIRAVRFVVRGTVEERILRLQDKKRLVFEGTVGGDAAALGQLSEDDLKFLVSPQPRPTRCAPRHLHERAHAACPCIACRPPWAVQWACLPLPGTPTKTRRTPHRSPPPRPCWMPPAAVPELTWEHRRLVARMCRAQPLWHAGLDEALDEAGAPTESLRL